jgi:hypothetical protein
VRASMRTYTHPVLERFAETFVSERRGRLQPAHGATEFVNEREERLRHSASLYVGGNEISGHGQSHAVGEVGSGAVGILTPDGPQSPERGRELRAAVGGEVGRDTETRDPASKQGLGAVLGSGAGHGERLRPAGEVVHDRQRADDVDV